MQPTHFRAYAFDEGVHNPAHEGAVEDGAANFTADKEIAYVVFYDESQESAVVVACVDGPFGPGEVAVAPPPPSDE